MNKLSVNLPCNFRNRRPNESSQRVLTIQLWGGKISCMISRKFSKKEILLLSSIKIQELFWSLVKKGECWEWAGRKTPNGYGCFTLNGHSRVAHRLAFYWMHGKIDHRLTIDHLCRNRLCVNPAHLEQVSQRENVMRGRSVTSINAKKTHCKRGHPFDVLENLKHDPFGFRVCRICRNLLDRRRYWQRKGTNQDGQARSHPNKPR